MYSLIVVVGPDVVAKPAVTRVAVRWVIESVGEKYLKSQSAKELTFEFKSIEKLKSAIQRIHKLSLQNVVTIPVCIDVDGSWEVLFLDS